MYTEKPTIQHKVIRLGGFQLAYSIFGEGSKTVICLHGHGRSPSDFSFLSNRNIKVIGIHLFFHNESMIPINRIEKNPINWKEVLPLFEKIFDTEKIDRFHLLGFSQGGRFCLLLTESIPERIISTTLLAPDGLNNNSFYNWSSRRKYMRSIMNTFKENPKKMHKWVKNTAKMRLIRPKVEDFVYSFSSEEEKLKRAADTWMAFRNLKPNPKHFGKMIRKFSIELVLITGKYDQIILTKTAQKFLQKADLPQTVHEIESGHDFFKPAIILSFLPLLPFTESEIN